MSLEKEIALFNEHRDEWCQSSRGKFDVIQDENIVHPFSDDWETGLRAGLKYFGVPRPFLVKQILEVDPVYFIGAA